uniref:Uncharacterized protein n=1 Tax=Nostoc sp. PCC 9205 TaxID=2099383 RepID=A0A2P0ZGM4_9NOSO|nr:hypothetical protein [Nostoc sp. PCC 9205]
MNITPYLLGVIGLTLVVYGEYILGTVLLIIAGGEIVLPNLNTTTDTQATVVRFGFIVTIASLMFYRLFYIR